MNHTAVVEDMWSPNGLGPDLEVSSDDEGEGDVEEIADAVNAMQVADVDSSPRAEDVGPDGVLRPVGVVDAAAAVLVAPVALVEGAVSAPLDNLDRATETVTLTTETGEDVVLDGNRQKYLVTFDVPFYVQGVFPGCEQAYMRAVQEAKENGVAPPKLIPAGANLSLNTVADPIGLLTTAGGRVTERTCACKCTGMCASCFTAHLCDLSGVAVGDQITWDMNSVCKCGAKHDSVYVVSEVVRVINDRDGRCSALYVRTEYVIGSDGVHKHVKGRVHLCRRIDGGGWRITAMGTGAVSGMQLAAGVPFKIWRVAASFVQAVLSIPFVAAHVAFAKYAEHLNVTRGLGWMGGAGAGAKRDDAFSEPLPIEVDDVAAEGIVDATADLAGASVELAGAPVRAVL